MKRVTALIIVMVLTSSLLFAGVRIFTESAALVTFNPAAEASDAVVSDIAHGVSWKFYFLDGMVRPVVGFGGALGIRMPSEAADTDLAITFGMDGFAGVSFVFGKNQLLRLDVVAGASVSESGWLGNAFASLWKGHVDVVYYSTFFGDVSVLFGDEELSVRGGLRMGPSFSTRGGDPSLSIIPYLACSTDLLTTIFN